jgi:hypothetical protein
MVRIVFTTYSIDIPSGALLLQIRIRIVGVLGVKNKSHDGKLLSLGFDNFCMLPGRIARKLRKTLQTDAMGTSDKSEYGEYPST